MRPYDANVSQVIKPRIPMIDFVDRFIFLPQPLDDSAAQWARSQAGVEEIRIAASDGVALHGWLVKPRVRPAPLLIYFGGNAEEVSWMIGTAAAFSGCALLLMNYRGYGLSQGKPGETTLFADARHVFDAVAKRTDLDRTRIAAIGRRRGSAVAVHLAAERPVTAVALFAPLDSKVNVGRHHYPFLPVGFVLRHRFDSLARAPAMCQPLLCLVAARDRVIPVPLSRRLFEAWGGAKEWVEFGADHNDIHIAPGFWDALARFVAAKL